MKKSLITILFIILPVTVSAFSYFSESPGEQTASAQINAGRCALSGILVITDGTNDAKVIVYDSLTASGTVMYETTVKGADHYGGRNWTFPLTMRIGIYVVVSGTGASYIPEYIEF